LILPFCLNDWYCYVIYLRHVINCFLLVVIVGQTDNLVTNYHHGFFQNKNIIILKYFCFRNSCKVIIKLSFLFVIRKLSTKSVQLVYMVITIFIYVQSGVLGIHCQIIQCSNDPTCQCVLNKNRTPVFEKSVTIIDISHNEIIISPRKVELSSSVKQTTAF